MEAQPDGVGGGESCARLIEAVLAGSTVRVRLPGVGAVVAALAVGRLRDKLSTNALLTISAACYAGALVVVVAVPVFVLAMAALVVAGMAWAAVISTFIAELQVFLPSWVRARALAVYLVIFTGSQALASVVWGQVADQVGVLWTFVAGAALVVLGTHIKARTDAAMALIQL